MYINNKQSKTHDNKKQMYISNEQQEQPQIYIDKKQKQQKYLWTATINVALTINQHLHYFQNLNKNI